MLWPRLRLGNPLRQVSITKDGGAVLSVTPRRHRPLGPQSPRAPHIISRCLSRAWSRWQPILPSGPDGGRAQRAWRAGHGRLPRPGRGPGLCGSPPPHAGRRSGCRAARRSSRRALLPGSDGRLLQPSGRAGTSLLAAALAAHLAGRPVCAPSSSTSTSRTGARPSSSMSPRSGATAWPPSSRSWTRSGPAARVTSNGPERGRQGDLGRDPHRRAFHADGLHVLCALDDPAAIDDYADPAATWRRCWRSSAGPSTWSSWTSPTPSTSSPPPPLPADRIVLLTPEDVPSQVKVARMLNLMLVR